LLAIHEGRFAEAEALARETLTVGRRFSLTNAAGAYGMQMFSIRREQGRLAEVLPMLRHIVATQADSTIWRPGLAIIYMELDLRAEALAAFEGLAADDFAGITHGGLWLTSMAFMAEVCAYLKDAARSATLYRLLLPYVGRTIATGNNAPCFGAADRLLGMLAMTMGERDTAQRHFETALTMNRHTGGLPWLAHTQLCYATFLLRNHETGGAHARELLEVALATARELGMAALEQRCLRVMETFAGRPSYPDALSTREVEVLQLLAAGLSNHEIGERLFISTHTVASHIRNILGKTGAANRTEAAAYAIRQGLTPG
jgi:DNA-binding CsgD family transcriptional regulator